MKRWNVLVTMALVAAASGTGLAAVPGANGIIDACYERRTGLLRVIDKEAGKLCLSVEVPLRWSVAGPVGDPGAKGDKGDKGEPGAPGTTEARVREQAGGPINLPKPEIEEPAAFQRTVQVPLPVGTYVLMARGEVRADENAQDAALGECRMIFDDSTELDAFTWTEEAATDPEVHRIGVFLLGTVTVANVPDDPLALLPTVEVQCTRFHTSAPATAASFKIVALSVGALF
jgi:hypothetical protein